MLAGMLVAVIACAIAICAAIAVAASRRSVAAGLVGEISEILNAIESHQLEVRLADLAQSAMPLRAPRAPTWVYVANAGWLYLLGPHLSRIIASFYASVSILTEEVNGLSLDLSENAQDEGRVLVRQEVERACGLGDEALRGLRDILSRRRHNAVLRA